MRIASEELRNAAMAACKTGKFTRRQLTDAYGVHYKTIPVKSLVFIDESCAKTDMCKLYGRSLRGVRCHDSAPGSWKTTTMLSSIGSTGETECLVFDGAVDGKMFVAYMKNCLLPVLKDNYYVMMENLSAHENSFDITKFEKRSIT
jgi:hypothetical protein